MWVYIYTHIYFGEKQMAEDIPFALIYIHIHTQRNVLIHTHTHTEECPLPFVFHQKQIPPPFDLRRDILFCICPLPFFFFLTFWFLPFRVVTHLLT
jgi:hypothetical protein